MDPRCITLIEAVAEKLKNGCNDDGDAIHNGQINVHILRVLCGDLFPKEAEKGVGYALVPVQNLLVSLGLIDVGGGHFFTFPPWMVDRRWIKLIEAVAGKMKNGSNEDDAIVDVAGRLWINAHLLQIQCFHLFPNEVEERVGSLDLVKLELYNLGLVGKNGGTEGDLFTFPRWIEVQ